MGKTSYTIKKEMIERMQAHQKEMDILSGRDAREKREVYFEIANYVFAIIVCFGTIISAWVQLAQVF